MSQDTLTITDNRTGKTYEVPVENDTIIAIDLRQIKVNDDDFGMLAYDPAFLNTASCKSQITYIDGAKGILRYRGYTIEQLAEESTYKEVAYLLIYGDLPNEEQLDHWKSRIMRHTYIHEDLAQMIKIFRYDAHPMGILISSIAAMSTFHPEARNFDDPQIREKQIWRILGKLPTIAAFAYRVRIGRPFNYPDSSLGYAGNFLYMLDYMNQPHYEVNPVLARALGAQHVEVRLQSGQIQGPGLAAAAGTDGQARRAQFVDDGGREIHPQLRAGARRPDDAQQNQASYHSAHHIFCDSRLR